MDSFSLQENGKYSNYHDAFLCYFSLADFGPMASANPVNTAHSSILFDVVHEIDIALYPDSGKIGIWGKEINRIFLEKDDVAYYTGE